MKKNFTLLEKILFMRISESNLATKDLDFDGASAFEGPSDYVLNNIFNYAKALTVVKLKQTKDYNLILN